MGKKNKGLKKVVVASTQGLESFKSGPAANTEAAAVAGKPADASTAADCNASDERDTHNSESQLKFITQKIKKDEQRSSLKDLAAHFFYLDNKLVEFHSGSIENCDFSQAERPEMLDEEVFLFYLR